MQLQVRIAREDLLGSLWRSYESNDLKHMKASDLLPGTGRLARMLAIRSGRRMGHLVEHGACLELTSSGLLHAQEIIRSHRLWEYWLVEDLGLRHDHVHETAMHLEHLMQSTGDDRLTPPEPPHGTDPHDRKIPPGSS